MREPVLQKHLYKGAVYIGNRNICEHLKLMTGSPFLELNPNYQLQTDLPDRPSWLPALQNTTCIVKKRNNKSGCIAKLELAVQRSQHKIKIQYVSVTGNNKAKGIKNHLDHAKNRNHSGTRKGKERHRKREVMGCYQCSTLRTPHAHLTHTWCTPHPRNASVKCDSGVLQITVCCAPIPKLITN